MKQIRLEPLNKTYQQLSTLLCKTALDIQTADYTATIAWTRLIQEIQHTCAVFKSYAAKEEAILFPVLHNYEPALVAILRDEQCNRMHYINELCRLFTDSYHATNKQKNKLFSHKLLYRFDEFVATTLQQINEHERMINDVLWRYYSDKELAQMASSFNLATLVTSPKNDTAFADDVISNIVPSATISSARRHTRSHKEYKQHRATKELALAV